MASDNLLITLLPSTDVDLRRWLLQYYSVPYTERPHAPTFHVLALKYWGFGPNEYPVLIHGDDETPTDPMILKWLTENGDPALALIPDRETEREAHREVEHLQRLARITVGDAVVNWSYYYLLQYKRAVWPSITTGVPWYEKLVCLLGFPLIRSLMYKGLKLDQDAADKALEKIKSGFDTLDEKLSDGREYLVADRLTYADLAVAASLGPIVLAQGYQGFLPNQAMCPQFMQDVYRELRERPTGKFIQRIYDKHRHPDVPGP